MNTAILFTLALIVVSSVIIIQPIRADSHTISVRSSSQLVNAIYGASDGTTIFVNSGTYEIPEGQTLVISKSILLIGEGSESTILNFHPRWVESTLPFTLSYYEDAIRVEASDVVLSGFTINSVGGSLLTTGSRVQITDNIIKTGLLVNGRYQNISMNTLTQGIGCYGSHNNIEENSIFGCGIVVGGDGNSNKIYGNKITDCNTETAGYGIRLDAGGNTVFNNIIENSNHAVTILGMSSSNNVYENTLGNNLGGLELFGQGSHNVFHNNYVANNGYGVLLSRTYLMSPGKNNTVYHNNFVNNTAQINNDQTYYGNYGSEASIYPAGEYDNGKEGNYWSDYTGEDKNNDGVGDSPYVVDSVIKDHYPLMQPWGVPSVSIFNLENATCYGHVSLNFTVSKSTSWIGYSLDGLDNVTITGNTTLTGLSNGVHNITLYAEDMFENAGTSETITFTIVEETETMPFPTTFVVTSVIIVAVIGTGLLIYFKKRPH